MLQYKSSLWGNVLSEYRISKPCFVLGKQGVGGVALAEDQRSDCAADS